ncbi:MAG TPA: chloride channel protein [Tepidisphaeraceae bacterium]|jgi:H+/Cl- antiporter ClcA|nr:chloride channel protein [Tepidisphaeraceae bacterium]
MPENEKSVMEASTTGGIPPSPSLSPLLKSVEAPAPGLLVDKRVLYISVLGMAVGLIAAVAAKILMCLIGIITNFSFFGRFSTSIASPVGNHLGWWIVPVPVVGGLIVGLMARYGSAGIRGHGIPEAMEHVLTHESRIKARLTFLKPLSAAIAIGTGGPFGAEGPIIATGGAIGSMAGQLLSTTAEERKTLLAAGAAAGMAATFACPVAAVLLTIELLLFEFRPRSFVPVALASTVATSARFLLNLPFPVFQAPSLGNPTQIAMAMYIVLGIVVGFASVIATRAVYFAEDTFVASGIHWMWCPAIGGIAVGFIGKFYPQTLGVGYENIDHVLLTHLTLWAAATLCLWKFISWSVALGSGTSGGTLAPLFTIGGALGLIIGIAINRLVPSAAIDPATAALVGMAAMFAGASRALLTSIVFAVETTLQPLALLPLVGCCTAAYIVSCLLMRNTIMTEKVVRRGVYVPAEYLSDMLAQVRVGEVAAHDVTSLSADDTVESVRRNMESDDPAWAHQGFPVMDSQKHLIGVLTRRDFADRTVPGNRRVGEMLKRPPVIVYDDLSLREAADHMINHDVGRLPVVERRTPSKLVGIVTRSDLLKAQRRRVNELKRDKANIIWWHRGERPIRSKTPPGDQVSPP